MPTNDGNLTAAEAAEMYALIQAQAALRQQITQMAVAAATLPWTTFSGWWSSAEIGRLVASVLRIVQPLQRQAAAVTDVFLARQMSITAGRRVEPVGVIDVTRLRRAMPDPGDQRSNPTAGSIDLADVGEGRDQSWFTGNFILRDTPEIADYGLPDDGRGFMNPMVVYGRPADTYRWQVSERSSSPEVAVQRAVLRAQQIAETDIGLAVREQSRKAVVLNRAATGFRRILHPERSKDGFSCGLCVVAADRIYSKAELLPLHPQCVPAGTRVAADGVLRVTRRNYPGPLVVLLTASGQELRITANHPVLTPEGWVPAHLVNVGDDVVRHGFGHGVAGRSPEEGDGPPLIEDVWRAASVNQGLGSGVVPLAAEDFHGDGADGEVSVVAPDRLLPRMGDVSFAQPRSEPGLVCRHGLRPSLAGSGEAQQSILGLPESTHGGVGGVGEGLTVLPGGADVAGGSGLAATAPLDSSFFEALGDDGALNAVLLSQGVLGGAGAVLLDNLGDGKVKPGATRFDPAGFEFAGKGRGAYAELGRDLLGRLAGQVEIDRVVDKRWVDGPHVVYNLHTIEGWYSANNCIVSNCNCEVAPILNGVDPGRDLNDRDLKAIYEAAGGTTAGRKLQNQVRVSITEHGELGPILVRSNHNFVDPAEVARRRTRQSESTRRRRSDQAAARRVRTVVDSTDPGRFLRGRIEAIEESIEAMERLQARGENFADQITRRRIELSQLRQTQVL